jgi:hypothetical protein
VIARGHRNRELFYALDCRKHLASAARLIPETLGLRPGCRAFLTQRMERSHAQAEDWRSSLSVLALAAQRLRLDGPKRLAP